MSLQTFTYEQGCWYLTFVATLYVGLTWLPESLGARCVIGGIGIVCVLGVGLLIDRYGVPE